MAKILVTDDSAFMRGLVKKILEKGGYTDIIEASNGQEAFDKFKSEKPDLVLLDILMNNSSFNGIEALRRIREQDSNAKVIMVTVIDQPQVTEEAKKIGADDFVTKPVDETQLLNAVKKALG